METETLPDARILYSALVNKDSAFEGIFVVGVKTTGIFCRPTCRAKKPKPENVEFFPTTKEALAHGYRACRLCCPMELPGATPAWLQGLLAEVNDHPETSLRAHDLRQRGVDPVRVRRWFKKHHGLTFQAYLRAIRISRAFGQIKHQGGVTGPALDNGYASLSGFHAAFRKTTGFPPSHAKARSLVSVTRIPTPLGPMLAGATEEGICLLEFVGRKMLDKQMARLGKLLQAEFVPGSSTYFPELDRQLQEYFAGARRQFDLPLALPGTAFQRAAWRALQQIPYGETRSYQDQARTVGNPEAVRAVARANGDNRIAIVIPCHRVIAKSGALAGYAGGPWRKQYLLNLERNAQYPDQRKQP